MTSLRINNLLFKHLYIKRHLLCSALIFSIILMGAGCGVKKDASNTQISSAIQYIDKGNYAEAYQLLSPLADKGDKHANFWLGIISFYANSIDYLDTKKGLEYFKKAADAGHTVAQYQIGYYISHQEATGSNPIKSADENWSKALPYFEAAAKKGYAKAQLMLGDMYDSKLGVETQGNGYLKALFWYTLARPNIDSSNTVPYKYSDKKTLDDWFQRMKNFVSDEERAEIEHEIEQWKKANPNTEVERYSIEIPDDCCVYLP